MKHLITSACLLSACLAAAGEQAVTGSPDGRLTVTVEVTQDSIPVYSVSYDGKTLLTPSPLGFKADIGDFSRGMIIENVSKGHNDRTFRQDRIKKNKVDYHSNTMTVGFRRSDGARMSVEWQISDNDVAFRYHIPRQNDGETGCAVIHEETTGFSFPSFTTTFLSPQCVPMVGWKRTKPSYEEGYSPDAAMDSRSYYGQGYTFPALFHIGDNGWVLVSETGVDGSYCGSHLSDYKEGRYTVAYPMPGENNGNGSTAPGISLPGTTPWRTLTVGASLAPIVETTAPWNLLDPLYEAREAIPGKGTWSWILWQDASINEADQKKYIDLAAAMGYRNVLVDNWWDEYIGRDGIKRLVEYASGKGVNLLLWYSSSGWWNDIVQGPTDIMSRPIPRKKEMKWLRDMGIKGVKIDFFGGDKQETMRLYEDILSDAADYGIDVIFHGCTLPRGWERLYPNFVGAEAVLASENLIFSQDFCNAAPFNATLHPFIRNAVGCMEYGGTVLNKYMNRDNRDGIRRATGDAFELATAVLFQNPVQNFALAPNNLQDAPAQALDFMKQVPTTWDDIRLIDGYPGKYVVLARRNGDRWYVAAVNATDRLLDLKLDLGALGFNGGNVSQWYDTDKMQLAFKETRLKKKSLLPVKIYPSGGAVIVFNVDDGNGSGNK